MVITVQAAREYASDVKALCEKMGLKHFWIELIWPTSLAANPAKGRVRKLMLELWKLLTDQEETVVVHCAAGVHRTGCIAYSLMRMNGLERAEAFDALGKMREETKKGVGETRIDIAE